MKISQVSKSLEVPVPTLRRWTLEFAAGLSPEARGVDGRPRVFSTRDLRLLRRAKELLAEDEATYASVRAQLTSERLLSPAAGGDGTGRAEDAEEQPTEAVSVEEERAAAERFIRTAAEPLIVNALRELRQQYDARLDELERELGELRAELLRLRREPMHPSAESAERRRWPFG